MRTVNAPNCARSMIVFADLGACERPRPTAGNNVNRLRTARSFTQETVAEKADVSRRYLQEIESGTKLPTVPVLARLRLALDCPWDELLKGL